MRKKKWIGLEDGTVGEKTILNWFLPYMGNNPPKTWTIFADTLEEAEEILRRELSK